MRYTDNPMDNRHDLENTMWNRSIHKFSSIHSKDIEKFLLNFMIKGGKRIKQKNVAAFQSKFLVGIQRPIDLNLRDVINDQLRNQIWNNWRRRRR